MAKISKQINRYIKRGQHGKLTDKMNENKRYQKYLLRGSLSTYKCSTGAKAGLKSDLIFSTPVSTTQMCQSATKTKNQKSSTDAL